MLRAAMRSPLLRGFSRRRRTLLLRPLLSAPPPRRMNHALATAASALRPLAMRAWTPVHARWLSLLQDLQDDQPNAKKLEQLAARVGLDEFAADVLPALQVLAESLQMVGQSDAIQSWTSSDWLLGLTVLAQHNTVARAKAGERRAPRIAAVNPTPPSRDELAQLLRFVRISDAVYADTADQFCDEAHMPRESVVRSFDGGVLAPKFVLLKDDAAQEIVLAVRGTASILDFCTDICLMNEPFADGQAHRGIVHAARWLVKNVRGDLEQLTRENPEYQLVITGHSLGAGVSALAAMELKPSFPGLRCLAFATPACLTEPLAEACADYVTTVVNGEDCVPRLHQHSMQQLQRQVSQFDWRTALKQMVDEEIEEQKTLARETRDRHLGEIYDAFQSIKQAQEAQAKQTITQVLQTPVGRRVSASLELTKAAFWTDQPVGERLASVKQVVQKQKHSGDDTKLWESVEATVAGLESLAGAITRREELKAILTKSKVLLASTGPSEAKEASSSSNEGAAATVETSVSIEGVVSEEPGGNKALDFDLVRARIKTVIDQTTQTLQAEVKETIKDVSETVTASVHVLKSDVEDAIDRQAAKLEESAAAIQSEIARGTEAIVKQTQDTAQGIAAVGPLLDEFRTPKADSAPETQTAETLQASAASEPVPPQTPAPEELLEPLFPPGRILYLHRVHGKPAVTADAPDDATELVELLHVENDEFSRVELSNRMILDHLCTTYERVLQATAAAMDKKP